MFEVFICFNRSQRSFELEISAIDQRPLTLLYVFGSTNSHLLLGFQICLIVARTSKLAPTILCLEIFNCDQYLESWWWKLFCFGAVARFCDKSLKLRSTLSQTICEAINKSLRSASSLEVQFCKHFCALCSREADFQSFDTSIVFMTTWGLLRYNVNVFWLWTSVSSVLDC